MPPAPRRARAARPTREKRASVPSRLIGGLVYWLPVLVPLGLFGQIALQGLRPALAEREHLARMRDEIELRHQADLELHDELGRRHRARLDPIFRERQRRLDQGPWSAR